MLSLADYPIPIEGEVLTRELNNPRKFLNSTLLAEILAARWSFEYELEKLSAKPKSSHTILPHEVAVDIELAKRLVRESSDLFNVQDYSAATRKAIIRLLQHIGEHQLSLDSENTFLATPRWIKLIFPSAPDTLPSRVVIDLERQFQFGWKDVIGRYRLNKADYSSPLDIATHQEKTEKIVGQAIMNNFYTGCIYFFLANDEKNCIFRGDNNRCFTVDEHGNHHPYDYDLDQEDDGLFCPEERLDAGRAHKNLDQPFENGGSDYAQNKTGSDFLAGNLRALSIVGIDIEGAEFQEVRRLSISQPYKRNIFLFPAYLQLLIMGYETFDLRF